MCACVALVSRVVKQSFRCCLDSFGTNAGVSVRAGGAFRHELVYGKRQVFYTMTATTKNGVPRIRGVVVPSLFRCRLSFVSLGDFKFVPSSTRKFVKFKPVGWLASNDCHLTCRIRQTSDILPQISPLGLPYRPPWTSKPHLLRQQNGRSNRLNATISSSLPLSPPRPLPLSVYALPHWRMDRTNRIRHPPTRAPNEKRVVPCKRVY